MFDIGFWELLLILLLMLFVLGPERLPVVAGYMGKWFGKIQRHFYSIRDSIDQETESSEINTIIKEQKDHMKRIKDEVETIKDDKNNILILVHDDQHLQEDFVPSVPGAGLVKSGVQPDDGENTMKELNTTPAATWLAAGGHCKAV